MTKPTLLLSFALIAGAVSAGETQITVQVHQPGKRISPDLFGLTFEDINYAADGGLCAELVQNRSFECTSRDNPKWNSLTAWKLIQRDGSQGAVSVESNAPLHANNPHQPSASAAGFR